MLFSGKRSAFKRIRLKRPTAFYQPGCDATPYGLATQAESTEQNLVYIAQHLIACRTDPYYGAHFSHIDSLKPFFDLFPEERSSVAKLVQQQRISIAPAYIDPADAFCGGESLLRCFIMGALWPRWNAGSISPVHVRTRSGRQVPQMPQILEQCGVKALAARRNHVHDAGPSIFVWTAPNGDWSHVYWFEDPEDGLTTAERIESALRSTQNALPKTTAALIVEDADAPTPHPDIVGRSREWSQRNPALVCAGSGALSFFSSIDSMPARDKEAIPQRFGQWPCGVWGRALSRGDLKVAARLLENTLFQAETWAAMQSAAGQAPALEDIDFGWRQLVYMQSEHGIERGGSELSFADLMDAARQALEGVNRSLNQSLQRIAQCVNTEPGGQPLSMMLFNSLPWRYDALVRCEVDVDADFTPFALYDIEGEEIPFEIETVDVDSNDHPVKAHLLWAQPQMPPVGHTGARIAPAHDVQSPYLKREQRQHWIETDYFRLEIDPDRGGGIVSLIDRETGKEWINQNHPHPANTLFTLPIDDAASPGDGFVLRGGLEAATDPTPAYDYYEGPVSKRLLVRGAGPGSCRRIQEIKLYDGLPFIDCVTLLVDYRGREPKLDNPYAPYRDMYLAAFPLNHPGAAPVLEDRFFARAGRRGQASLMDARPKEWSERTLGLQLCERWVDVSWGFRINFMENGEERASLAPGPTEVFAPEPAHRASANALIQHFVKHGVEANLNPDPSINGDGRRPSFLICLGTREQNDYTHRLLSQHEEAAAHYARHIEQFGAALLFVNDDSYGTLPVMIMAAETSAGLQEMADELIHATVSHRWDCPASACFIPNLAPIDNAGFAVFHKGTPSCALLGDDALLIGLMQTAPFQQAQTRWPADIADRKTHVFSYRLYPHAGDWRLAETPRRAMEYQIEPAVTRVEGHPGSRPALFSNLSLEPANIIVSAIKPAGYDSLRGDSSGKPFAPMIVRGYEAHGESSNLWLESSFPLKNARRVSLLEEPFADKRDLSREGQSVRSLANAHEILTLQLDLKPEGASPQPAQPDEEPAPRTVASRYWRLNSGAAPPGFLPAAVSIRGIVRLDGRHRHSVIHPLDVAVANNDLNRSIQGEVEIETPEGWRAQPERIAYRIQPGGYQVSPIHLILEGPRAEGALIARTRVGGHVIEDLLQIGPPPEFDLSIGLSREGFNVMLRHVFPYEVRGEVRLILPVEAWGNPLSGECSLTSIEPCAQPFAAPSGHTVTLPFAVNEPSNRYGVASNRHWMIIKLTAHHCIRYYHIRLDGRPSEGLGAALAPPYAGPSDA